MSLSLAFFKKYGLFLLLVLMVTLFIGVLLVSFFAARNTSDEQTVLPTPTPVSAITERERAYPEATTQPFYSDNTGKTGTLIVTANIPEARVMIDSGEEDTVQRSITYPVQITPFKIINMPTGQHSLTAAKRGYILEVVTFSLAPNEVKRIHLVLKPIQSTR